VYIERLKFFYKSINLYFLHFEFLHFHLRYGCIIKRIPKKVIRSI